MWTEHRNTEGRTYWFNTATKQSVWEKPDDLKTPFEKALKETKWREYFSQGRKYYYNTETKDSKWDMPDELLLILEKVEKEGKANAVPTSSTAITGPESPGTSQGALAPMGGANQSSSASHSAQQNGLAVGPHTGQLPLATSSVLPARPNLPDDPVIPHNGFPTIEEAEKAFMHLFRKAGVDATWTWDQTMRAIITDPLYRALNTLAEKKACWEKYTNNLRAKEQEEKEARLAKLRPAIRNMLKGNPNVFHYTTFPTADKLFAQHPIWQQARIESERRMIFEEYIGELKQREMQESRASRARSVQKIMALFKQLNVDVVTRWKSAYQLIVESEDYRTDPELQKLPTLDVLLAFEDYSRVREREYEEQMRRAQVEKTRKERKAREAFKDLLQNLVKEGKIKARSKWKEVYPIFRDDVRYLNMLGNPGSNPLELFWDIVDTLDQQLDRKIAIVEEAFARRGAESAQDKSKPKVFVIGPETTEEEYNSVILANADDSVRTLAEEDVREVYNTLHDIAVKKQADERRRAERKLRHLQDDLRYAFKKLSEPLDISLSYEDIVPNIEHLAEYKALEDEDGKRAAWAKYVKRQKEKMREAVSEDGASTTSKKRKEPHRDERERDRDDKGRDRDRDREREREREKDREREREKDRDYRDRDRERDRERERPRDYERDGRSSRHHHRYDDFDGHRSSRDYGRERDKDHEREKERDGYRSHKHYREDDRKRDREGGHKERKSSRSDYGYTRDWDEPPKREERERSASLYGDETRDKHEDRHPDERAEKRVKLDRTDAQDEAMVVDKAPISRAETPEEGEI